MTSVPSRSAVITFASHREASLSRPGPSSSGRCRSVSPRTMPTTNSNRRHSTRTAQQIDDGQLDAGSNPAGFSTADRRGITPDTATGRVEEERGKRCTPLPAPREDEPRNRRTGRRRYPARYRRFSEVAFNGTTYWYHCETTHTTHLTRTGPRGIRLKPPGAAVESVRWSA